MGLTRVEYNRLMERVREVVLEEIMATECLGAYGEMRMTEAVEKGLGRLDDETAWASWSREQRTSKRSPGRTAPTVEGKHLCPRCGCCLARDTASGKDWWRCPNNHCRKVSIRVIEPPPPPKVGPLIALAMAGASPAEFASVVLGIIPNKTQTAMLNSRFGTRSQSEARRLFREEMGLD